MNGDFAFGLILGSGLGLMIGCLFAAIVAASQRGHKTPTLAYYGDLHLGESIHIDAYHEDETTQGDDGDSIPPSPVSPELPHNHPIFRN